MKHPATSKRSRINRRQAIARATDSKPYRDPMREALGPGTQFVGVRGTTLQAIAGRDLGCL